MNKILKYELPNTKGSHIVNLPWEVMALSIEVQNNIPVLYVIADLENPTTQVNIEACYTGDEVKENFHPIGRALLDDGEFVLHYFLT